MAAVVVVVDVVVEPTEAFGRWEPGARLKTVFVLTLEIAILATAV